ncbi:MAG: hypothetical protein CBC83_07310 [Flavobacteriales bacterium TMED123]|nr:MAG: hypothetical protein CBC83_07310 [Flavobacteriales bacterium TMED123]|tara:strand:+ start:16402 stop:18078 length:1677 start_codon:yes stop_codon:yes gene_type:complete
MKNLFLFSVTLLLFACSGPNTDLELEEILLINKNGEKQNIEALSDLENEKDSSKRLVVSYTFSKRNVKSLKSGLLQIDKRACFSLFLNDNLVFERKKGSFFQDTLLATKKDSFIYVDSLVSNYFIPSTSLQKILVSGENIFLLHYHNPKYYKLKHQKTKFFLSKNNKNYPQNIRSKKLAYSSLPFLFINTNGVQDEPKQLAKLNIKNRKSVFEENIQIEIRGNTSQSFEKKSFSFFIINKNKQRKKVGLVGLPKHEHWILYGPYADKSLIRNVLAYRFWEEMGYYAPKTKFCELSINGFYQGVYILCEKIRVDSIRLDLKNGYLLKIDRPKVAFFSSNISVENTSKTVFEIKYPNKEIALSEKNAIENFVHLFEETLFLSNPNSLGVFEIIDMNSFVDFLIINELCKNIDAYRLSTYFQINENKKVVMGPIWDFNFSLGLTDYLDGYKTEGFVFDKMEEVPFWWEKLTQNIYFKKALINRWKVLRQSLFSKDSIEKMIDLHASELSVAAENNFDKWHLLGQKEVWPNYYIGNTHRDEVEYLEQWLLKRVQWLDKKWSN